jgi:hypothetical protein
LWPRGSGQSAFDGRESESRNRRADVPPERVLGTVPGLCEIDGTVMLAQNLTFDYRKE